jgi:hypothetical protein
MRSKEELLSDIAEAAANSKALWARFDEEERIRPSDSLGPSDPYRREIDRLQSLLKFTELGVEYEEVFSGCVRVKQDSGKYLIYALRTGKWRNEGRSKWYRGCKVENFVNKYVKKS